jgi:hypothetical protein
MSPSLKKQNKINKKYCWDWGYSLRSMFKQTSPQKPTTEKPPGNLHGKSQNGNDVSRIFKCQRINIQNI